MPALRSLTKRPKAKVRVILIPGLETPPAQQWSIFLGEQSNETVDFWTFEHQLSLSNAFTWFDLTNLGLPLVEELCALQKDDQRPLILLGHSLGGVILKVALGIAYVKQLQVILDTICAAGFIGTPHGTRNKDLLSEKAQLLIRALMPNVTRKCLMGLGEKSHELLDSFLLFEEPDLDIDFLSVFETGETKIRKGQWIGRSRRVTLVDKPLAQLSARKETLVGSSREHQDLCLAGDSAETPNGKVLEWFSEAVRNNLSSLRTRLPQAPPSQRSVVEEPAQQLSQPKLLAEPSQGALSSNEPTLGSSIAQGFDMIPLVNRFQSSMKPAELPCYMIENRLFNPEFFGRNDIIQQMDELLLPKPKNPNLESTEVISRPRQLTLLGQGGLGKSEIAIHFAFTRMRNFDAVFWVRADDPGKLEEDFGNIARHLGLEDPNQPRNHVASRELAKGWLSNSKKLVRTAGDVVGQAEAHWLIVFDNADDSTVLDDYWPIFGSGSILLTSRDPSAKDRPGIAGMSIRLQPLDDQVGAALFLKLAIRKEEESAVAERISHELGGLPLAIAQMAGIVRFQMLSLSEFLSRYQHWPERDDLYKYSVGGRINLRRGTIASVFALNQLDAEARSLLEVCSMMDPDCIQESLFIDYNIRSGKLRDFPQGSFRFATARTDLLRCSLIQRNEENKEFSLHRLVQDAIKATMDPSHRKLVLQSATDLLATAWGTTEIHRRHIAEVWKNREDLYPHVLNVKSLYENWRSDIGWAGVEFAALLNEAGWFMHERGNQPICKSFCESARAIIEHEQPGLAETGDVTDRKYDLLCDILYALGALANESNDRASCMRHCEQFLKMRQRKAAAGLDGVHNVRLALSYNQYGVACMMFGEIQQAITSFHESISTYVGLGDRYEKGMDSNPILNASFAYWLNGDLDNALILLTNGLKDRESVYGYMDRVSYHTGRFHHALGNVKLDEGLLIQSEQYHRNALVQYQSCIGEYHHKTADVCHRVAQHYMGREDWDNAQTLIDQALKAWNMQPASYQPEIARTTFLSSKLARLKGNAEEADRLREDAAHMREKVPGAIWREVENLEETDFDELVTFWSR